MLANPNHPRPFRDDRIFRAYSAKRFFCDLPRARGLIRLRPDYKYFTPESLRGKRYAALFERLHDARETLNMWSEFPL